MTTQPATRYRTEYVRHRRRISTSTVIPAVLTLVAMMVFFAMLLNMG
ncbi:hypothetical protein GCM10010977_17960 [Citricoccus zhacaiensis]|uniref:ABC transporter permease n=1 Tax=Citricoccus zhacaiensis TaxID=489142 RepID=A0ABQ2M0B5_9MICC|nr:hypothetical protein [Citricoccus zhacaiensis]GGO45368.1 hypothetical protein GCM10010977_17960 [Citricoccus zhacaiensis]